MGNCLIEIANVLFDEDGVFYMTTADFDKNIAHIFSDASLEEVEEDTFKAQIGFIIRDNKNNWYYDVHACTFNKKHLHREDFKTLHSIEFWETCGIRMSQLSPITHTI